MVIAEIYFILENWKISSFDIHKYSTRNPNVAFSIGIRVLCPLFIATIALNKAIKGKGRFKGTFIFHGADCTPILALEEEE